MVDEGVKGTGQKFSGFEDARLAYDVGVVDLRALVQLREPSEGNGTGWLETTVGRIIFNDVLPDVTECLS